MGEGVPAGRGRNPPWTGHQTITGYTHTNTHTPQNHTCQGVSNSSIDCRRKVPGKNSHRHRGNIKDKLNIKANTQSCGRACVYPAVHQYCRKWRGVRNFENEADFCTLSRSANECLSVPYLLKKNVAMGAALFSLFPISDVWKRGRSVESGCSEVRSAGRRWMCWRCRTRLLQASTDGDLRVTKASTAKLKRWHHCHQICKTDTWLSLRAFTSRKFGKTSFVCPDGMQDVIRTDWNFLFLSPWSPLLSDSSERRKSRSDLY